MSFFTIALIALCGCDLFDSSKVENPIFGPPPPRRISKAQTQPAASSMTAEASSASGDHSPQGTGNATAAREALSTARGTAPPDEDIKRTGFTRQNSGASSKLSGNEVVATVNGQAIFALEVLERAFPEPLPPEGMSLLVASKNLSSGRISEPEYRALQETAIKRYLKDFVQTRVLAQQIERTVEKEQRQKIDDAINKMFDEYVDQKLKKDLKAAARHEVDRKLREQGTSLASLKVEFRYRLLADEYVRQKSKKAHLVGREEVLSYYNQHIEDYSFPEKVRWQLLEVNIAKHGGAKGALDVLEKAVDELRQGVDFAKVAKKYSEGPAAEQGGKQSWTRPDSVLDEKTAAMLRQLPKGQTSPVLHTHESYRLIRVLERKPAGRTSLAEVQDAIRQKIEDRLQREARQKVLAEAYSHASVESAFASPQELLPPADSADLPRTDKDRNDSPKKRRERS